MADIKIVFFDIDGTLVDMETKQITPKAVETLKRLRANGIKICVATGRSPISVPKLPGVEFDAWLTYNGSLCYNREETIYSNPIPADDVQRLIHNAAKLRRPVSVGTRYDLHANGADTDLTDYYALGQLELRVSADFEDACREAVYQVMLGCRDADHPAILDGVAGAVITSCWPRAVDVIPKGGGKGMGIRKILEYYRLDASQALAFGDGNNDLEMLQTVGTGIAMGNASQQLKAVADGVCGTITQDGIYHYCLEHGLI